jgi:sugar/nucleoside kinase (ribokinase family)
MARVLVAGDAMLDVHATPAEPIRPGADVPAEVRLGVGGQGANLAVRLAQRGLDVRLACAIGDEAAGPLVVERLSNAGVSVLPIPTPRTGTVVILVDPAGERTMLSDRVPFVPALAARLAELAASVDWIVVSGYLLEEPGEGLVASTAGGARRALVGCPFRDTDAWKAHARTLAPDLLVLNRGEAAALTRTATRGGVLPRVGELATALAADGVADTTIVTDVTGAAAAFGDGRPAVEIAIEADLAVVDTTGAGDAFAATVLADLHGAWPADPETVRVALERAASVAAAVVRVVGAQGALQHSPEVTR